MTYTAFLRNSAPTDVPPAYRGGLVLDLFPELSRSTLTAHLHKIVEEVGQPTPQAIEFAMFSAAVYAADKKSPRGRTEDRWTRSLQLSAPVSNVEAWVPATPILKDALEYLTGDLWSLGWRQERTRIWGAKRTARRDFDAVCLFSGGLDSLIGAVNLLELPEQPNVVLLGHYDSTRTPRVQEDLANVLKDRYGPRRVELVQVMVRPAESRDQQQYQLPKMRENTTRSRSLVFLGLGLAAASALRPETPLYIPENGFIALNVPLIGARLGSCSTRTTHPHFLKRLGEAIRTVGITNPIINPYRFQTKGEMLMQCANQELIRDLARMSISCAHPEVGRYERTGYGNCGYCFPCLIRRASMHAAGLDDPGHYGRNVCTDRDLYDRGRTRGRDARALFEALQLLSTPLRSSALAPALAGPVRAEELGEYARLYRQGMQELQNFFEQGSTEAVRQLAGL
ncbi:MAG: hypothetical protein IVW55_04035 [Chloroflexi bacterium]|nr:hypothetical protein [Chloroflexota bacterium]